MSQNYPQEADMEFFCINVVFLDSASPLAGFRLFLLSTMSKYNMAAIKDFFLEKMLKKTITVGIKCF